MNGSVVEGRAEARGDLVRVTLRRGWVDLPKAAIERIEPGKTPWEDYAEKAAALEEGDKAGHAALARWCRERGLPDEAREQSRMAGEEDPSDAAERGAREALLARRARAVRPPEPLPPEAARPLERWPEPVYRGPRAFLPCWSACAPPPCSVYGLPLTIRFWP